MTRPRGSADKLQRRRERAIRLLQRGMAPVDVARIVGVDRRSVRRWKAAYQDKGMLGIKARPSPGRSSKLEGYELKTLGRILNRGAKAAGFATDEWSYPQIREIIEEEFGVQYHTDHIGRLLHSLKLSLDK